MEEINSQINLKTKQTLDIYKINNNNDPGYEQNTLKLSTQIFQNRSRNPPKSPIGNKLLNFRKFMQ